MIRLILLGWLIAFLGFPALGGEVPDEAAPPKEGVPAAGAGGEEHPAAPGEREAGGAGAEEGTPSEEAGEEAGGAGAEGDGRAPEGMDLSLGEGGSAQLQFADGTTVQVKENSKAKVSREKKGRVPWSFLSFEEGVFLVEGQNGPLEYILPGMNVLGVGAKFQVTVRGGKKIEVTLINQGPGVVVATDPLTDMQVRLEPDTGISATVDKAAGKTVFRALAGNSRDVLKDSGGVRSPVSPGETFQGREGGGEPGGLRAEEEAKIDEKPPTEMVEYRFTMNTGFGGKAEFTFRDGGHGYVSEETSLALSVVKRKTMVNLKKGEAKFALGSGEFLLETEVAAVSARSAVFFAEVTDTFDRFKNLQGEMILVRSKKEGPSEGMVMEVKPGMGLLIRHGPDVPGVIFEVPDKIPGEMVFKVRGKTLRMPAGSRLTFGEKGSTVTVMVPTPEAEFVATIPLEEVLSAPADAALHDTGDLIATGNVSP